MEFLKAKEVRLNSTVNGKTDSLRLTTSYEMTQDFYAVMKGVGDESIKVVIYYDNHNPPPKKVSLSANQRTMLPFTIWIALYKKYCKAPYKRFLMGELRSLFELEEETTRIVIEFTKPEGQGKVAQVKLIANYVKF